jgi:hypothetical protein
MTYVLFNNNTKNDEFFNNDYNDNHCMIFNPTNDTFAGNIDLDLNNELLFIITLDNSSIYDYFEINFNSIITYTKLPILSGGTLENIENITLTSNQHFIVRGQYVIYEFAIKRNSYYSSPFNGILGFKPDNSVTRIEIDETVLASIKNNSFTVLDLRFKSSYIRDEEERYQNTGKLITINLYIIIFNS